MFSANMKENTPAALWPGCFSFHFYSVITADDLQYLALLSQ